jgi:16S rRNA (adenine1518-N6/adenine1519-N6)-dimethyltransferase
VGTLEIFERVVRGVFLQRRKRLVNAFKPVADSFGRSALDVIAAAGVDGTKRPEELTLRDMAQLSRAML